MGEWYSCLIRWSSSPCSERCSFGAIWDKEEKTLTSPATHSECHCTDGSDRNVSNPAGKLFERCAGKDLRVQLNGYAVTLSGWKITKIPDKLPGFFRTQLKYSECKEGLFMQEIFFEVQGLTEWVYFESWASFCVDLGNRSEAFSEWLTDNKKSWLAFLRAGERSLFYVKAWDTSPEKFHFKYLDENFTLTLYDKCIKGWDARFRFSYERKCHFGIRSSREHDKEFFETLIRKITYFLTLLFGKEAVANRIWESDKQQWGWNYNPSEKESSADDHPYPCISYDTIRDKFKEKLTAWLSKYECYGTIIDCFFRDSPKVLPEPKTNNISEEEKRNIFETFFRRLQLLEMYGNVSTKGENTMNSLRGAVEAVHKKVWGDIIRDIGWGTCVARPSENGGCALYHYTFGDTPEYQKKDFVGIVTALRSYFVHPYRDGKKKTPFSERIEKFFTTAGCGSLENFEEVTSWLSQHLSVILHCVLLQSKNARGNKGVTKPSQNLFPETNHTREDFGKIILKYLRKCRDHKETAEKISKAKSILLYSPEEAARKTPCGEISGSRSIDIVPTEEQLRCLSEVLTELTCRCEKEIKEAFERDESQKFVAYGSIYECITHDFCGGSKGSSVERQSLGELISNLKKSFDPNTGSLLCEQFTDYRDAEVNFKALTALTNGCLEILHQLLLQEAGLLEFVWKKARMHK